MDKEPSDLSELVELLTDIKMNPEDHGYECFSDEYISGMREAINIANGHLRAIQDDKQD